MLTFLAGFLTCLALCIFAAVVFAGQLGRR